MCVINVKNLVVNYGNFQAVKDISFKIKKGELFALLGTNGAGKTTTINVLLSLKAKQGGEVFIEGNNIEEKNSREKISAVFQTSVLDNLLTVKENLWTRGSLYNLSNEKLQERIKFYSEKLEFTDILNKRYGKLSGGQKRKVDVARALMTEPQLLILDEPTTGLDPKTRKILWRVLEEIQKEKGMTILLTTHYMEEAANADNVVIMHEGVIKATGTPGTLKEKYAYDTLKIYYKPENLEEIKKLIIKFKYKTMVDFLEIKIKVFNNALYDFLNLIKEKIESFELIKGDMDTVFLNVTGQTKLEDDIYV